MGSGFKIKTISIMMIIVVMTSCIPDPIEVRNVVEEKPKIVVSSEILGSTVTILLTKSIGPLDANANTSWVSLLTDIVVSDATVRIQSGSGQFYTLNYHDGAYSTSSMPLIVGQTYTLNVGSTKYGLVTATTILQPQVKFTNISAEMNVNGRDSLALVNYSFADKRGSNWYMVSGQHLTGNDPGAKVLNPRVTYRMYDDVAFEGGIKKDTFKILFDEVAPGDTVNIRLSSITKEYYDYMKLRQDTRFGIEAALGEPVNYPTNVVGGLGFFNLYMPDSRTLYLPR
ncbi:MAG: DUF4249 domain-containing protein [Bacteroidota bacterium]